MDIKISVVIPSFNAETTIEQLLISLKTQITPVYEIIVVDDCSKDDTLKCIEKFENLIIVKKEENEGAAKARSTGAEQAKGELIAFIDADCVAPPDWSTRVLAHFEKNPRLGALGGGYSHPPMKTWYGKLGAYEEAYIQKIFSKFPKEASPIGGNSVFKSEAWKKGRTGREEIYFKGMGSGEDSLVGHDVRKNYEVFFDSTLLIQHASKDNFNYLKRHLNRGFSRASIILNGLTSDSESNLIFKAMGGVSLLLSTVFFGISFFSFLFIALNWKIALSISILSYLAHLLLSWTFFKFIKEYDQESNRNAQSSLFDRFMIRLLLLVRSAMWISGAIRAVYFWGKQKMGLYINVILSILHFWFPGRISKLFFFVTSKCNARCSFCFNIENVENWKARKETELTLEEIQSISKNFGRLPYLTLSGGEPFIRKDLPNLIHAFYKNAHTQWVTIPTNAALTDRTLEAVRDIVTLCPNLFLTIQVSLDSLDEDHNTSRKIPDGFNKMLKTLEGLAKIREHSSNLRIQLATCYGKFNEHRIKEILEFCRNEITYDQQIFYLIRESHTLFTEKNKDFVGNYVEMLSDNERLEWNRSGKSLWNRAVRALQGLVYRDMLELNQNQKFIRPCYASRKFATLWDNGSISPCEILEKTDLGNLRDYSLDFYRLKKAKNLKKYHQKEIVDKKCNCDWMCAPPINMLYDPKTYWGAFKAFISPGRIALGKRGEN